MLYITSPGFIHITVGSLYPLVKISPFPPPLSPWQPQFYSLFLWVPKPLIRSGFLSNLQTITNCLIIFLYSLLRAALTQYHKLGYLNNLYSLKVWEARGPKPRHCRTPLIPEGQNPSLPFLEVVSGSNCWSFATLDTLGLANHHPISVFIFTWCPACVHVCLYVHISPFL